MKTMIITEITITAPGENLTLEADSSKYLVNPPCPEGILILLSFATLVCI